MSDRLILLLSLAALVALAMVMGRELVRRRTTARLGAALPASLPVADPVAPTVLYFFGPHCAACASQKRALDALVVQARPNVVAVDASREADLAAWAGVLTIPSTAIVDPARRLRAVNHGFQSADVLVRQLAEIA